MYPVLFELGPLKVHAYGFMLAVAFLVGIFLAERYARQIGENPEEIGNVSFWIILAAIVGSRLFHVVVFWDQMHGFLDPFKIWEGGLVYYGGFIGAVAASAIYCTIKKKSFWQIGDLIAPSIALGLMFGRTGCLLVGCCYGKPCPAEFPLGITFPDQTIGLAGVRLYPTQPAEALGCLAIFLLLWFVVRNHRRFRGQVLLAFVVLYSLLRTVLEFWRDDPRGFVTLFHVSGAPNLTADSPGLFGFLLWARTLRQLTPGLYAVRISESQLVSALFIISAIACWIWRARVDRRLGWVSPPLAKVPLWSGSAKKRTPANKRKGRK